MTTTRAAVYLRISDDDDGEAEGVERQRQDCLARAAREGWAVRDPQDIYCDNDIGASTRSGSKPRPDYDRMVAAVKRREYDVILAYSTSRLRRRPLENEALIQLHERTGVKIRTIVSGDDDLSTADGRQMARIRASIDAGESERIAERVSRKARSNAQAGKFNGGRRPFGFEPDGVTIRKSEADEIVKATRTILNGGSLRAIARDLNDRGVTTTTGKAWTSIAVKDLLRRPRNSGLVKYNPVERDEDGNRVTNRSADAFGPASWDAIVSDDQRLAVVAILADPRRKTSPGNQPTFLGSSIYLCGVCGEKVRTMTSGGRATRYVCNGGKGSGTNHLSRNAEATDSLATDKAVDWLTHLIGFNKLSDVTIPDSGDSDWSGLTTELKAVEARRTEIQNDYADGYFTREEFRSQMDRLRDREADIRSRMSTGPQSKRLVFPSVETPADVRPMWDSLTIEHQREIMRHALVVTILPTERRGTAFDSESVRLEANNSPYEIVTV